MRKETQRYVEGDCFQSPLLDKLSDLAYQVAGIRFVIIFPKHEGWDRVIPGEKFELPKFCSLIQASKEGAKHCKMCHILMAIAVCRKGSVGQSCHAGASVLSAPICEENDEGMAILGTCTFAPKSGVSIWKEIQNRAQKLDINSKELSEAYHELPALSPEEIVVARTILEIAAEAARELRNRYRIEAELEGVLGYRKTKSDVEAIVRQELKEPELTLETWEADSSGGRKSKGSVLVKVVADLVSRRPHMPFNVAEIASAARITPNHFSTLFHLCMGQSFTEFHTDRRIEAAKELLRDLTINIGEVALDVGYSDAGYFTRRFKQKTGMTPREWRNTIYPT